MNRYDLDGKVAVITGAARGIGYSAAERLLQSGASICIWDADGEAAQTAVETLNAPGRVLARRVDIAQWEQVAAATQAAVAAFGGIDMLVNNAGIAGPNLPLWEFPVETWRQIIDIDLVGVFLCCRAVVPVMLEKNAGRIVNVSSVAGKEGNPNASGYSAAKAGVIALTKSLGKELAKTNIRVNAITPATVATDILKQFGQEQVDYMLSRIPIGRLGTVEENAAMIAFLCSPDCSFSTGAVFDTSGGRCTY
ncbi:MAG: SDR family oxidoreductase [Gammaproteobacteria bacterium]|nr:SDR family oxidoreductase [Gammaproteobacteria bacterium]